MRRISEIRSKLLQYRKGNTSSATEFVLIVKWVHLFPSRTQKLSTCTPTIVAGRLAVKIGNANTKTSTEMWRFLFAYNMPPTERIFNNNTESHLLGDVFSLVECEYFVNYLNFNLIRSG